jgi:hypothetical protein
VVAPVPSPVVSPPAHDRVAIAAASIGTMNDARSGVDFFMGSPLSVRKRWGNKVGNHKTAKVITREPFDLRPDSILG